MGKRGPQKAPVKLLAAIEPVAPWLPRRKR